MPKYKSVDTIPAKTFFTILESKNYQLLKPKPSEKGLEQIFISIYDEFFIKSDNPEAKQYLETTTEIAQLKYKIATLKQSLHFYFYNQTTEKMRNDFIEALQIGYNITIDKEQPFFILLLNPFSSILNWKPSLLLIAFTTGVKSVVLP